MSGAHGLQGKNIRWTPVLQVCTAELAAFVRACDEPHKDVPSQIWVLVGGWSKTLSHLGLTRFPVLPWPDFYGGLWQMSKLSEFRQHQFLRPFGSVAQNLQHGFWSWPLLYFQSWRMKLLCSFLGGLSSDSAGRIQFLVVERWRLSLSRLLSSVPLLMFLLIAISNLVMDWGDFSPGPLALWSPSAFYLWFICSSSAFLKIVYHVYLFAVWLWGKRNTHVAVHVWMLWLILSFPLQGPGDRTQGMSLDLTSPLVCFQGLVL